MKRVSASPKTVCGLKSGRKRRQRRVMRKRRSGCRTGNERRMIPVLNERSEMMFQAVFLWVFRSRVFRIFVLDVVTLFKDDSPM